MLNSMDIRYQQMKDLHGIDKCLEDSSETETDSYILNHRRAKRISRLNEQLKESKIKRVEPILTAEARARLKSQSTIQQRPVSIRFTHLKPAVFTAKDDFHSRLH